jgi:esterase/lipase
VLSAVMPVVPSCASCATTTRSGALAVILSFMSDTKHVVLIHGSWGRGEQLALARAAFEERGYTAHTPTLRHHELP